MHLDYGPSVQNAAWTHISRDLCSAIFIVWFCPSCAGRGLGRKKSLEIWLSRLVYFVDIFNRQWSRFLSPPDVGGSEARAEQAENKPNKPEQNTKVFLVVWPMLGYNMNNTTEINRDSYFTTRPPLADANLSEAMRWVGTMVAEDLRRALPPVSASLSERICNEIATS